MNCDIFLFHNCLIFLKRTSQVFQDSNNKKNNKNHKRSVCQQNSSLLIKDIELRHIMNDKSTLHLEGK